MPKTWVLDSFAVLALLGDEAGADEVARLLREAQSEETLVLMTWVNLGEVAYIVERRWGEGRLQQVLALLESTGLQIAPVERSLALAAAQIKAKYPLAYADAFAAALTRQTKATLVTGDPEFGLLAELISISWLPSKQ
jgi:ribonuclease VapC